MGAGAAVAIVNPIESSASAGAFDAFYQRHFHSVVALVYVLAGSRWAAEELAQEAFVAVYRRWDQIATYESPEAWVKRVAMNHAVSRVRRRAAEARALVRVVAKREAPSLGLPPPDADFWAAVRKLPTMQARVVALHYCDDLPVTTIAEVLGVADGTVKTHLHRARGALAVALGETLDEEEGEVSP